MNKESTPGATGPKPSADQTSKQFNPGTGAGHDSQNTQNGRPTTEGGKPGDSVKE